MKVLGIAACAAILESVPAGANGAKSLPGAAVPRTPATALAIRAWPSILAFVLTRLDVNGQ